MKFKSLKIRIATLAGLCMLAAAGTIIVFSSMELNSQAMGAANDKAVASSKEYAGVVKAELGEAADAARGLAQSLSAIKNPSRDLSLSRDEVNAMMIGLLENNPTFLGVYTCWEPNAFDGRDDEFAGTEGHDQSGRYIPYWNRDASGNVALEPLADYDISDYYTLPKNSGKECIIDPYLYPVQGKETLLTSLVVPIMVNGRFLGITGIDIGLSTLQELADAVDIYDGTGVVMIYSNNCNTAAYTAKPELVGKLLTDYYKEPKAREILERTKNGDSFDWEGDGVLRAHEPILIGKTTTPWSVVTKVPYDKVTEAANKTLWQQILIGVLLVAAALGFLWFVAKAISDPISFLTTGAQRLAKGDVALEGMDTSIIAALNVRDDELGDMGRAFGALIESQKAKASAAAQIAAGNLDVKVSVDCNEDLLGNAMVEMTGSLQKVNSELQGLTGAALEGQLDTRADTSAHRGDYGKLVGGINELFDAVATPIKKSAVVLQAAADKDLTPRVDNIFKGQLAEFVDNLNTTVEALDGAMQQVGEAVEQVSSASGQISSGSQSLAQGANEQASALEEISSSLEEMSSMTKQNADNANQAKNLSGSAREAADKGSGSMEQMTDAINRIKTSSDETAKIVKTIDEIAFQTNLLALNAAVEAARAGEAGKGFAVVAEEVRNLAQRSAEAAKNTTELIDGAVKNAEDGVSITNEVAKVLIEIVDGSGKVNDLVAEISAAAGEQAQGIEQVNTAVSQMDQVTQQNASNSEESASAAEELNSQAEELQRMVGEFNLSQNSGSAVRSAVSNQPRSTVPSSPAAGPKTQTGKPKNRVNERAAQQQPVAGSNGNGNKRPKTSEAMIPLDDDDFGDF